jgi:hypothetical protein
LVVLQQDGVLPENPKPQVLENPPPP